MEDYVGGEKADYKEGALRRMLCNWPELEAATTEPVIIYKWDIELAIDCLSEEDRKTVFTVMAFGESVINNGSVSGMEWGTLVRRLFSILNNQGLIRKDNEWEVTLQTDKSRPWTPKEIHFGEDTVYGRDETRRAATRAGQA
jgi:hypothetical protein